MPELRWALLLLGLLFVVGLIAWELAKRRGRVAPADESSPVPAARPGEPSDDQAADEEFAAPEAAPVPPRPAVRSPRLPDRREALREPPLVEIVDPSVAGEIDPGDAPGPALGELPRIAGAQDDDPVDRAMRWLETDRGAPPTPAASAEATAVSVGDDRDLDRPPPRLEWPDESERRIAAVRVMPVPGERFNGALLRQALAGEGFVHGEFDIFHWPLRDGRVVLSAASLTKPGSFKPSTMDAQQFAGLNLFAVLPGPLGGGEAVNQLLATAEALAGRLRGQVRDQAGEPFTEARVTAMRREFAAVLPVIRVEQGGEPPARGGNRH